jgi:hypothetical protein
MQHTVRLLLSAEHIAINGSPMVRFSGSKLDYLRKIRAGEFAYDEIMKFVNDKTFMLEELFKRAPIADCCDTKAISALYDKVIEMQLANFRKTA